MTAFLASEAASFVTGTSIDLDGGASALLVTVGHDGPRGRPTGRALLGSDASSSAMLFPDCLQYRFERLLEYLDDGFSQR